MSYLNLNLNLNLKTCDSSLNIVSELGAPLLNEG
jgi:hypothetical protein